MRCRGTGAGCGPSSSLHISSLPSAMRVAVSGWICSCTTGFPRTPQAKQALGGFYATGSKGPAAAGPVPSAWRPGTLEGPRPMRMVTIIPALDEEAAIGSVVRAISRELVHEVIVVDNGSRDGTAAVAQAAGAPVIQEPQRGYGAACSPAAHGGARAGQAPRLAGECIDFNHRGGPSMTQLGRATTIRCLVFALLVLAATSGAQTRPPIAEQIAKTYGLDSFGQIEAIRYTFNLDLGALKLSHAWVWEPKADRISYEGKDKAGKPVKATYVRSQLSSQPAVVQDEVDPAFVNDQYWLVLPFHVVWDSGADVQDLGMQKL